MNNKEKLLVAAKACIYERGYARTTARDIATAAGTSLAAIGYHFGSKEALLQAAIVEAMREWGDERARALAVDIADEGDPTRRFESVWAGAIESFTSQRPIWAAQVELLTQAAYDPAVREWIVGDLRAARIGLADLVAGIDPQVEPDQARRVGSFYQALLTGVLVQWLVDPESAPSSRDLAEALRTIAADTNKPT